MLKIVFNKPLLTPHSVFPNAILKKFLSVRLCTILTGFLFAILFQTVLLAQNVISITCGWQHTAIIGYCNGNYSGTFCQYNICFGLTAPVRRFCFCVSKTTKELACFLREHSNDEGATTTEDGEFEERSYKEVATEFGAQLGEVIHGRATFGTRLLSFAVALTCLVVKDRAPDQTNCKPARIAIVATTVFNFWAGTLRASKQPRTTPGMPPPSNCNKIGVLMEPNVQCTALPMMARTSPKTMSVPTTCVGAISE